MFTHHATIKKFVVGAVVAAATIGAGFFAAVPASADSPQRHHMPAGAVFIQNNGATGNSVTVFDRASNGSLTRAGTYRTGGRGGSELGAVVDPLASQGSLVYDGEQQLLFAVNAGSNTLSVFKVHGDKLQLREVLPTRGLFPTSVAVAGHLVYVLNAGGAGSISGFRALGGFVVPLAGSTRSLGLGNADVPAFLQAPAQVAISPDRAHLVVATKANNTLEVFGLGRFGEPSATPAVNTSVGAVPFALTFDIGGRLQVANASGSASSYQLGANGTLTLVSGPVTNGQAATCWTTTARGYLYAANAGSATITGYKVGVNGALSLLQPSGISATTHAGPVDLAATPDGRFIYQLATGAGAIDEFAVSANGALTQIGAVTGLPADNGSGIEGIAIS
ncbi:MAG: beta-propeller fold lactonase family protein [Specibacter sp.]